MRYWLWCCGEGDFGNEEVGVKVKDSGLGEYVGVEEEGMGESEVVERCCEK